MSDVDHIECGGCFGRAYGFQWPELAEEGWKRHHARKQPFHLCADCARRYEELRRLNALFELEPAREIA